jgi:hypothetical protein
MTDSEVPLIVRAIRYNSPISHDAIPAVDPDKNETTGPGRPRNWIFPELFGLEFFVTVDRIVS